MQQCGTASSVRLMAACGLAPAVKVACTCCRKQEFGPMSSKFVAYNSSKAALNMQSAVLANRWASSHSKTGMRCACHLSSSPQTFELAKQSPGQFTPTNTAPAGSPASPA